MFGGGGGWGGVCKIVCLQLRFLRFFAQLEILRKSRFFAILVIFLKFVVLVVPFSLKFGQYSLSDKSYENCKFSQFHSRNFRKISSFR